MNLTIIAVCGVIHAGVTSNGERCVFKSYEPTHIELRDGTTSAECESIIAHIAPPTSPNASWVCGYTTSINDQGQP